jgi:hypothetical protein
LWSAIIIQVCSLFLKKPKTKQTPDVDVTRRKGFNFLSDIESRFTILEWPGNWIARIILTFAVAWMGSIPSPQEGYATLSYCDQPLHNQRVSHYINLYILLCRMDYCICHLIKIRCSSPIVRGRHWGCVRVRRKEAMYR